MSKKFLSKKKKNTRDREATQRDLLNAAVKIFASRGYDAATTKAVAKEADVAEALIQRYFESKQGLLMALIKEFGADESAACLNLPPKAETFEAEIKSLLNHALERISEKKDYIRIVISRAVVETETGKQIAKSWQNVRTPPIAARLRDHQTKGTLARDLDAESLAYGIALMMLAVGFFGQIVLALDDKLIRRIVLSLAKALRQ